MHEWGDLEILSFRLISRGHKHMMAQWRSLEGFTKSAQGASARGLQVCVYKSAQLVVADGKGHSSPLLCGLTSWHSESQEAVQVSQPLWGVPFPSSHSLCRLLWMPHCYKPTDTVAWRLAWCSISRANDVCGFARVCISHSHWFYSPAKPTLFAAFRHK